jgi:uncharacterized membrane protein YciS (DUF1049 family)
MLMDQTIPVSTIANLIQLSIAPVFLLAGIGAILNVLAHRLGRVVDRARLLEQEFASYDEAQRMRAGAELGLLARRISFANLAIVACTTSALFVCLVVALMFVADLANFSFATLVALLFIVTMALLVVGLLLFLFEIRLAMRSLRVRRELLPGQERKR